MHAIRCTKKLLDRGATLPLAAERPATTILGDWYANIVVARPMHVVVCISEITLLPVVVTAKNFESLPERLAAAVKEMLRATGVPNEDIEAECIEMRESYFAKTSSRKLIGSLNDFVFHLQHGVGSDTKQTLHERALRMASMPCSALEFAYPREAAVAAFARSKALKAAAGAA
jgi:hypothetical protein